MAKKKEEQIEQVEQEITFDFSDKDVVTIVATKDSKHLKEGEEFVVSGETAKVLIKKGLVKVK